MPLRSRPPCAICQEQTSKYACASCRVRYCTIACYKQHKETCSGSAGVPSVNACSTVNESPVHDGTSESNSDSLPSDPQPLRPLTTVKWPYVPETSAYPDPLTRDDPKPLQMHQYESIATSPTIRTLLADDHLCTLLKSIDALRGVEREEALQRALGLDSRFLKNDDRGVTLEEDTRLLRAFAEAVEGAVRGGKQDVLGLDWD